MSDLKPAIRFLSVFLGLYVILNLIYGLWIRSYGNEADAMTFMVSRQTAFAENCSWEQNPTRATVTLKNETGKTVLNVFEGCNGLNVMIVFLAFVFAFGGAWRKMIWFIPLGFVLIHIFNLTRLFLLFYLSESQSAYFYYYHKYIFTAVIYVMVFGLWWIWIRINGNEDERNVQAA